MDLVFQSALGMFAIVVAAWAIGERRANFPLRFVIIGVAVQMCLTIILLKTPGSRETFVWLNNIFISLDTATRAGTSLVFGYLGGGPLPFAAPFPGAGFILAFQSLPIVLVISALSAVLFHWGILQRLVLLVSALLQRSLGVGGAVGISAAANVFVGMVEAPLLVRPYLSKLSRSELFMIMTLGMSTIAGTVMALYAGFIAREIPGALGHLVAASLISMPAAIIVARLMVPPNEGEVVESKSAVEIERSAAHSTLDAITRGTASGLTLYLNILAMLIVFVALVAMFNQILALLPDALGQPVTLERVFGWAMAPVAWLIGVPWDQAVTAGSLIGVKTVLNEFLAYLQLSKLDADMLDDRSRLIMTYALCGFANFGSLGIMLGGLTAMVPERREEIVGLGLKSILSGTFATLMTGAAVGMLTW